MPTYTAYFGSASEWALLEIKAATPEKALAKARATDFRTLDFEPYYSLPVNQITIRDSADNDLVTWHDEQLLLELAAASLLEAAKEVIACWESGDLANAVRQLNAAVDMANGGAA